MVAKMQPVTNFDLCEAVLRQLKQTPQIAASEIAVEADEGVITLTGLVRSRAEKSAAEKAAMEVSGIRAVASDIDIKPLSERADTDIAKAILQAFHSHMSTAIDKVKLIVSRGRVSLEGAVPSQFDKLLAEAAAKSVWGITGIENNIEVKFQAPSKGERRETEGAEAQETALFANEEPWAEIGAAEAG